MATIHDIVTFLEQFAPLRLAEDWDNVGLLAGHRDDNVQRVMTCLTVTSESAAEAIDRRADLVVTHHPLPFQPLQKLTTDTTPGRLLWELVRHGVAIYSPHTAFDSAAEGINQQLATALSLRNISPLVAFHDDPDHLGSGRCGELTDPVFVSDVALRLKEFLSLHQIRRVGDPQRNVVRMAVACGSGGSFLAAAQGQGCDLFITGEMSFHGCLEAEALGLAVLLVGHFASERFACERLAHVLQSEFADQTVWAAAESDPLRWI